MSDPRAHARELARESIARVDLTDWFERLYSASERDGFRISWVDLEPNPYLLVVARSRRPEDPHGLMRWPLTRTELDEFAAPGLELGRLDEVLEPGDPPIPRFVAEFVGEFAASR